jgi:hypothetical protein
MRANPAATKRTAPVILKNSPSRPIEQPIVATNSPMAVKGRSCAGFPVDHQGCHHVDAISAKTASSADLAVQFSALALPVAYALK